MKMNIYDQAVLEGVATSFTQTEEIIDNGKISGMTATDVQKILNLKHAWEFILDRDVIASRSDYYMLSHIARVVNEGFFLLHPTATSFISARVKSFKSSNTWSLRERPLCIFLPISPKLRVSISSTCE